MIPEDFGRVAHQVNAAAVDLVAFQQPAICLDLLCALSVLHPQHHLEEVKDGLSYAYIALYYALLSNLLVLNVDLKEDCADELALRRLLSSPYQMKEGIEKQAGHFALLQAFVLAHTCDLLQLHLNELDKRLEVVSLTILALGFDVSREDEACMSQWDRKFEVGLRRRAARQIPISICFLTLSLLSLRIVQDTLEYLKEQVLKSVYWLFFRLDYVLIIINVFNVGYLISRDELDELQVLASDELRQAELSVMLFSVDSF